MSAPRPATPEVVLLAAERYNRAVGHENLGPLSAIHGFLPPPGRAPRLPASHVDWDERAAALPHLHRSLTLRRALEDMPVLSADRSSLPDTALQRSATILGVLAHAYFHVSPGRPQPPPPSITEPWAEVCRRLGRTGPFLSYIDLIVSNWRLFDLAASDPMRVRNLRLLVPTVDNEEERIFYLTQTEILARTAPVVAATARAGEAIRIDDPDRLAAALQVVVGALTDINRLSLSAINPRPSSSSYVDPVVWAKTVAPFAVPIAPGPLGPSGTASPLFNLLDSVFQRPQRGTRFGEEIRGHRSAYPPQWRRFLDAVDAVGVRSYVERRGTPSVRELFREALDAYGGPQGFLSRHRRKVFGYLEVAFTVGRDTTIGGFSGAPRDRTWVRVDGELEASRLERGSHEAGPDAGPPPAARSTDHRYTLADLVLRNDDEHGYWLCIDDGVYDVSEFVHRHPGGPAVLRGYAGRDATDAYHRLHATSAAAAILLRRSRIGVLVKPDLPRTTARSGDVGPAHLFDAWAAMTTSVVDMQNTLRLDQSLRRGVGRSRDAERPGSPYLLERRIDVYRRFVVHYLRPTSDAVADRLWPCTVAASRRLPSGSWMRQRIDDVWRGPAATAAVALPEELRRRLVSAVEEANVPEFARIEAVCEQLQAESEYVLAALKRLFRDGILIMEGADQSPQDLGGRLARVARRVPDVFAEHLWRVAGPTGEPAGARARAPGKGELA